MNNKYGVRWLTDNEWEVYSKYDDSQIFKGSLEAVNAWISLEEKGFIS